jgi:hypothetical protein
MSPRSWICEGCRVESRFVDCNAAPDLPRGWAREGDSGALQCLSCRRQHAVEAALVEAGVNRDSQAAVPVRHETLVLFESKRTPHRSSGQIARALRLPPRRVARIRRELVARGALPQPSRKPRAASASDRAEVALLADHERSNRAVAEAIGGASGATGSLAAHRRSARSVQPNSVQVRSVLNTRHPTER